jgi:hypothetical protein
MTEFNDKAFIQEVLLKKNRENSFIDVICEIVEKNNFDYSEVGTVIKNDRTLKDVLEIEFKRLKMLKDNSQDTLDLTKLFK